MQNVSKLTPRRRSLLLGCAALFITGGLASAQFGIPSIVFDPSSYGQLVTQATTAYDQLQTIENNLTHFSVKNLWQTERTQLENFNVANAFGETSGLSTALNGNAPASAATGWQMGAVGVNTTSYLAGETPGASTGLSQLALVEATDAISPDCLNSVGQYRQGRADNLAAQTSLDSAQLDTGDDTNSEVQQLNLLNAGQAQALTEAQAQGPLQSCIAAQMTLASMQQRNAAAVSLNDAAIVAQENATNNTNPDNESETWETYIP